MLLTDLSVNDCAVIVKMQLSEKLKRRLGVMGVTKGVKVTLIRRAPLGDPLEIKVRGFYLALRLSEAQKITVVKV